MLHTISSNFVKANSRCFDIKELNIVLEKYSKRFNIPLNECYYSFVSKMLDDKIFFSTSNIKDVNEALYIAIYWSSLDSFKDATKKTKANLVKAPRDINTYTRLQSKLIDLIYSSFEGFERESKIEYYLTLFFELNCVQRKRKSK